MAIGIDALSDRAFWGVCALIGSHLGLWVKFIRFETWVKLKLNGNGRRRR